MSATYFILMPLVVLVLAFGYNFIWKVMHEYTHLAALKLIVGKELYSYDINLRPHFLGNDWVSASLSWKARALTQKEHGFIAIAPHILEFIACLAFVCSGLLLINDFMREHFYIFFMWATFSFGGIIDLLASANAAENESSDLNVFAKCYNLDVTEIKYLSWFFGYLSIVTGFAFIWIVL